MIGLGKSIAHTVEAIGYGGNPEKGAVVVHSQYLASDDPREVTEEFRIIQGQNGRCQKNTLSFVLSPTVEDGKKLSTEQLGGITQKFLDKMNLKEHQAIAFVHRDKGHVHIHLYTNRIGFDGRAYSDGFIGKRSQKAAHDVAKELGLTTAKEVQRERELKTLGTRSEIREIHEKVMQEGRPKDLDSYIKMMHKQGVKVIPTINRANRLQGFRFGYEGHNFKASEVHRSLSGPKLLKQVLGNGGEMAKPIKTVGIAGKSVGLATNLATGLAKGLIKKVVKKSIDLGMGI